MPENCQSLENLSTSFNVVCRHNYLISRQIFLVFEKLKTPQFGLNSGVFVYTPQKGWEWADLKRLKAFCLSPSIPVNPHYDTLFQFAVKSF
jgi:hypothetical protein